MVWSGCSGFLSLKLFIPRCSALYRVPEPPDYNHCLGLKVFLYTAKPSTFTGFEEWERRQERASSVTWHLGRIFWNAACQSLLQGLFVHSMQWPYNIWTLLRWRFIVLGFFRELQTENCKNKFHVRDIWPDLWMKCDTDQKRRYRINEKKFWQCKGSYLKYMNHSYTVSVIPQD